MKHVVILGAGFGGLEPASRLSVGPTDALANDKETFASSRRARWFGAGSG